MTPSPPRRVSLSSWAVHRWLGYSLKDNPSEFETATVDTSRLLELPARASAQGIKTLEVCHFHLPRKDMGFLEKFKTQAAEHGVQLFSLLIDDGDLAHPEHHQRDVGWIEEWIEVAAKLGFERVRIIAGKQNPTPEMLDRSFENLSRLAKTAKGLGVRATTENWHQLASKPEPLLWLLEKLQGEVGLCFDFGNWHGPTRHTDLAQIAHLAESCHAKSEFNADGTLDIEEYRSCLELVNKVGFSGPFTLVHGLESGEWASLKPQQEALRAYV